MNRPPAGSPRVTEKGEEGLACYEGADEREDQEREEEGEQGRFDREHKDGQLP